MEGRGVGLCWEHSNPQGPKVLLRNGEASGYGGLESILKVLKEEIKIVDWSRASLSFGSPVQIGSGSPKPIIFENNENLKDH